MNFNYIFLVILGIVFSLTCQAQRHRNLYSDLLEPESKLVSSGYNFTLEKLEKEKYIYKRYYTENRQITHYFTYTSKSGKVKNGLYYECFDDGTLYHKGEYINDIKHGKWIEGQFLSGNYENGKKEGVWLKRDSDNRILNETSYKNGKLDGISIAYDSLGNVKSKIEFKDDRMITPTPETDGPLNEKMPQYPGCEYVQDPNERVRCEGRHLSLFLAKHIVYPQESYKLKIQGTALVEYVVDKDGSVRDVKVLQGISGDIKEECYRVMSLMPEWSPGMQNDEPVRVKFTIPIRFQIE